jgi:hypothetical protein
MIPAMTTDAERECFYRIARDGAPKGDVVELGAWLGASSAWIAAGVRDSGADKRAKVYDRFADKAVLDGKAEKWCAEHGVKRVVRGTPFEQFQANLGPLLQYVEPTRAEIGGLKWNGGAVAALICDAPKRVREISAVLTTFRKALQPGSVMAWQDFCHFPSYEIPACLYRLRDHIEFVEAVVPGTTMVFRVTSQWKLVETSQAAFDLGSWSPEEVARAWAFWGAIVPEEKLDLFDCGAAMFLCDLGFVDEAVEALSRVNLGPVIKKWRYLRESRPDFLTRYRPLFSYLALN